MKKSLLSLAIAFCLILAACHFGHCAEKQVNIVASTYPVWLFAKNITAGAGNINLELLVPAAAGCPHDFSLRPADLQKLDKASILIINGAGMEAWLAKPLSQLDNKPELVDAGQNVPVLDSPHGSHVNEHIFAAPGTAAIMVGNIGARLASLDPANAAIYAQNGARFVEQLKDLSDRLHVLGQNAKNRKIILEHDALAYLASNAGMEIVAIVENAASATELAKIRDLALKEKPALLAGDAQYPDRLLKALAAETQVPFTRLNTCASGPADAPADYYIKVMTENLQTLEKFF